MFSYNKQLLHTNNYICFKHTYINSLRLSVRQSVSLHKCEQDPDDRVQLWVGQSVIGVLGGGEGKGRWSSERPVSVCDGGWTIMVFVYKSSPQSIAAVRRVGMTVGLHPSPTAPEANIKTFPSPPTPPTNYRKNRWLYRKTCFWKFPKLSGTKVQNVKTGVLGFLTSGKGINTQTNNLRVHTVGFDTRTTSVGTTTRSGWLEWHSHRCPKVTGTTSMF